jgi:hypothetical protein
LCSIWKNCPEILLRKESCSSSSTIGAPSGCACSDFARPCTQQAGVVESECNASNRAVANLHSSAGCGSGPACSWVPRAHRRQAVRQLGMQRLEESGEQLGPCS